jgi:hypothetical protein
MVEVYQELAELISQGRSCVLITVAESQGSGPMTLGKKLLIRDDFSSVGTIGGGALEFEAIETAKEVFHQRESRLAAYLLDENQQIADHKTIPMICGGTVKLFYEYLSGGEKAYIFGGGHVGRALVRQLDLLGFYTTIVEDREDVFQDIAEGKERVFQSFDAFIQKADIDEQAFVVVCTPLPRKRLPGGSEPYRQRGPPPLHRHAGLSGQEAGFPGAHHQKVRRRPGPLSPLQSHRPGHRRPLAGRDRPGHRRRNAGREIRKNPTGFYAG